MKEGIIMTLDLNELLRWQRWAEDRQRSLALIEETLLEMRSLAEKALHVDLSSEEIQMFTNELNDLHETVQTLEQSLVPFTAGSEQNLQ